MRPWRAGPGLSPSRIIPSSLSGAHARVLVAVAHLLPWLHAGHVEAYPLPQVDRLHQPRGVAAVAVEVGEEDGVHPGRDAVHLAPLPVAAGVGHGPGHGDVEQQLDLVSREVVAVL